MKKTISKLNLNLLFLSTLLILAQNAGAECVAGSVTLKATLYNVSIDPATRLITYQEPSIGSIVKRAALSRDCVGSTTYTVSGTRNLPYPNGTRLLVLGKNNFASPTPTPLALTVINGSIDSTVTAAGAQTGRNSDSFATYKDSVLVIMARQPWR